MNEEEHKGHRPHGDVSGRLRILLIEDDPGDAYLVRDFLESGNHDYDVTWVRTIAEAARALPGGGFDCALFGPRPAGVAGAQRPS